MGLWRREIRSSLWFLPRISDRKQAFTHFCHFADDLVRRTVVQSAR
jgi:hypothetical protein